MAPAMLPKRAWWKHSAGTGSHGQRYYSWAWVELNAEDDTDTGQHHLLIRRNDKPANTRTCAATAHGRPRCTPW